MKSKLMLIYQTTFSKLKDINFGDLTEIAKEMGLHFSFEILVNAMLEKKFPSQMWNSPPRANPFIILSCIGLLASHSKPLISLKMSNVFLKQRERSQFFLGIRIVIAAQNRRKSQIK